MTPVYEERQNANYPLVGGVILLVLAVGLVPGFLLGGLYWLTALYTALTIVILASFFQMRVEILEDKLVIKFGLLYRKVIERGKILACSPYKIRSAIRIYGGWGIRRGRDGTFALTQAFMREAVKLETTEKTYVISSRDPESFSQSINSRLSPRWQDDVR